jgi:hypothetical protein
MESKKQETNNGRKTGEDHRQPLGPFLDGSEYACGRE